MFRCAGHPYDETMNLREQQAKQTYEKIFRTAWEMLKEGSFESLSVDRAVFTIIFRQRISCCR